MHTQKSQIYWMSCTYQMQTYKVTAMLYYHIDTHTHTHSHSDTKEELLAKD